MKIGELSRMTGVPADTIRYYEKAGLLPQAHRRDNAYRVYGEHDARRLLLIKRCRALGMSMDRIGALLYVMHTEKPDPNAVHAIVAEQLKAIEEQMRSLRGLKAELLHLQGLCQGGHQEGEVCPLYEELDCCKGEHSHAETREGCGCSRHRA